MKILILLCTFNIALFCQYSDSTVWLEYKNTKLNLSLRYPPFCKLSNEISDLDPNIIAELNIGFTYYPEHGTARELGISDTDEMYYLSLHQSLDLIISTTDMESIAKSNGFLLIDSLWYDEEMYEKGWSDEPAQKYSFDEWHGYNTYTPARIYMKGGGCVTTAGEMRRLILCKKISNNLYIHAIVDRFDFDRSDTTLKKILRSISINQ